MSGAASLPRMSALRSTLIGLGTAGAIAGLLFGTGVITLNKSGDDEGKSGKKSRRKGKKGGGIDPELESLSYLNTDQLSPEEKKKTGVTRHVPEKSQAGGISLGVPVGSGGEFAKIGRGRPVRVARLIGMDGKELHSWEHETKRGSAKNPGWAMAKFGPDGFLYAVDNRFALVKLDWESKEVWTVPGRFHHDVEFRDDGGTVVLEERFLELDDEGTPYHLLDDGFVWISADGEVEKRFWIHEALADEPFYQKHIEARNKRWRPKRKSGKRKLPRADFIHANTVDILDHDVEGVGKKGDVLTALRELDEIAVFSAEDGSLKWHWGVGELDRPHDPDMQPGGSILVFDNGWHRDWSRVVEVNPVSGEIEWTYKGTEADPFWSKKRGLSQVLSNGNVLVNSTQRGRSLEVTREGEIVWEYYTPDIIDDFRLPIRLVRLEGVALDKAKAILEEREGIVRGPITKRRSR